MRSKVGKKGSTSLEHLYYNSQNSQMQYKLCEFCENSKTNK